VWYGDGNVMAVMAMGGCSGSMAVVMVMVMAMVIDVPASCKKQHIKSVKQKKRLHSIAAYFSVANSKRRN